MWLRRPGEIALVADASLGVHDPEGESLAGRFHEDEVEERASVRAIHGARVRTEAIRPPGARSGDEVPDPAAGLHPRFEVPVRLEDDGGSSGAKDRLQLGAQHRVRSPTAAPEPAAAGRGHQRVMEQNDPPGRPRALQRGLQPAQLRLTRSALDARECLRGSGAGRSI